MQNLFFNAFIDFYNWLPALIAKGLFFIFWRKKCYLIFFIISCKLKYLTRHLSFLLLLFLVYIYLISHQNYFFLACIFEIILNFLPSEILKILRKYRFIFDFWKTIICVWFFISKFEFLPFFKKRHKSFIILPPSSKII